MTYGRVGTRSIAGWQLGGRKCFMSLPGQHFIICLIPCSAPRAVESHLDHFLHDHMAAEVVTR